VNREELNKIRDQLASHLKQTEPLHVTMGYTATRAFIEGFDTAVGLILNQTQPDTTIQDAEFESKAREE